MTRRRLAIFLFTVLYLLVGLNFPASAQDFTELLSSSGSLAQSSIQLLILITLLSLVPGLAVMITCFPFVVTVLSILRQAIGLQQSPPNMLIVSLALFLTYFIMEPVFLISWENGIEPYVEGIIDLELAFTETMAPFREFMANRTDPETYAELSDLREQALEADTFLSPGSPLSILMPSFLLSEIERAFQIGFLIFLPFLIIDLVVAAVLMSMGMMMVPPAMVALPFKLAFFVVANGWTLISGALVRSYF
ncbi:MAG: flagellar type III secretion system pore protein FliP [Paracoccaceae bacterium]